MRVSVFVRDRDRRKPVQGVHVSLAVDGSKLASGRTGRTARPGEWSMAGSEANEYIGQSLICSVEKNGFEPRQIRRLIEEDDIHIDLELVRIDGLWQQIVGLISDIWNARTAMFGGKWRIVAIGIVIIVPAIAVGILLVPDSRLSECAELSWKEVRSRLPDMTGSAIRECAVSFANAGDPDNAFLVFKQAAKKGDELSATAIGEMYDPMTFESDPSKTPFSEANPKKALEWYDQALAQGDAQVKVRIDRLITRLEKKARAGDPEAKRILAKRK